MNKHISPFYTSYVNLLVLIFLFLLMMNLSQYSIAYPASDTRPTPQILSISFDKDTVEPGEWVIVVTNTTNDGLTSAPYQTIHSGLPLNLNRSDIHVVYTNLDMGVIVYPPGGNLGEPYGPVKSKYTIMEGVEKDGAQEVKALVVKIRMPDVDVLQFDVKTVACDSSWRLLKLYPTEIQQISKASL